MTSLSAQCIVAYQAQMGRHGFGGIASGRGPCPGWDTRNRSLQELRQSMQHHHGAIRMPCSPPNSAINVDGFVTTFIEDLQRPVCCLRMRETGIVLADHIMSARRRSATDAAPAAVGRRRAGRLRESPCMPQDATLARRKRRFIGAFSLDRGHLGFRLLLEQAELNRPKPFWVLSLLPFQGLVGQRCGG
jgi:hypothetical protein